MNNKKSISKEHKNKTKKHTKGYMSRCMADIEMKPIDWIWKKRFATKVNVIAGIPGVSKSQLALKIIETITTGGNWPDGSTCSKKGSAIIISSEDDASDTIKPRLLATGANLNKVHFFDCALDDDGNPQSWTLERFNSLVELVEELGDTRIIVIDPITAYLGKNADSHNTADVRGLMKPMQDLAEKHHVCILLITHLNKNQNASVSNRITGSNAWVAVSRSAWLDGYHPDDQEQRVMVPVKNNIGDDSTGFSYIVKEHKVKKNIWSTKVSWREPVEITPSEVLIEKKISKNNKKISEKDRAMLFVENILQDGEMLSDNVKEAAEKKLISKSSLKRAREELTENGTIEVYKKRGGENATRYHMRLKVQNDATP